MPDDIRLFCNSCMRNTRHVVAQVFEYVKDDGQILLWQTVQCGGCGEVSFYGTYVSTPNADERDIIPVVYPPRIKRAAKHFANLDARLENIYQETIEAFNNNSFVLCAGGLRTLVEGICADQNIVDGPKRNHTNGEYERDRNTGEIRRKDTLDCKIEGLAERNILTERQAHSLHEHRYLGNMALHELEMPRKETLESAITIVEHILEDLYSIPAHVDNLARTRGNN
jgi:hypothetical protein